MKILLDECIDHRFRREFADHDIATVGSMVWNSIKNGELLKLAEQEFDVFITADANLRFQQNFTQLDLAIIILKPKRNKLQYLKPLVPLINEALNSLQGGEVKIILPPQ
ncbi:MAG: DUF5615 family PIN-like protein [SAR324 cluster bacterium]|nr:DUF5615 family PIN-like protein [SAR324 cluster bacterium]